MNFGQSVTLEWIEFGCVHKLYSLNRIVRTSRSSTCDRNWFEFASRPYAAVLYDPLSQQQLLFLYLVYGTRHTNVEMTDLAHNKNSGKFSGN